MSTTDKNEQKKSILIVCQHFWPETFRITDICEGFIEKGYRVDVLCGIPNYPAGKFFRGYGYFKKRREVYKGINVIRVPEIPRGNNSHFRIFINYISFPLLALFYIPYLATKKYDRIMVYSLSPVFMAIPGIILAKMARIKLYIYVMDFWPHSVFSILTITNKYLRSLLTKMSYWHYRQADGVIGLYKGTQLRLISEVGIDKNKTIYVPQAPEKIYEKEVFDAKLKEKFKDKLTIVFAGNINPAQSFETILGAVKKLSLQGYDFNFIVLGEGMSKKWLIEEVNNLGLDKHFTFIGHVPVEEVVKYQTIADMLVVALTSSPLFEYSIPAKVQSYLAAGRPIVAAMNGEGRRIINESEGGICAASGDIDGLYDAFKCIFDMSDKARLAMGKKGQEYHFKYYERNQTLDRLANFVFNDTLIPDTEYEGRSDIA